MAQLKTVHLTLPASHADLRALEIGNVVYLTGRLFTAREKTLQDGWMSRLLRVL